MNKFLLFLLAALSLPKLALAAGILLLTTAPTIVSTTTWDPSFLSTNVVLSNGNLTATGTTGLSGGVTRSIAGHSAGKYYAEFTIVSDAEDNFNISIGISNSSFSTSNGNLNNVASIGYFDQGPVYVCGSTSVSYAGWGINDVIGIAFDRGNQLIWFQKNGGVWNGSSSNHPDTGVGGLSTSCLSTGNYNTALSLYHLSNSVTANFGATTYTYTDPSGFGNW